jgi:hypothetical protein
MGSMPSKSIVFALSAKIHEELMSKSHRVRDSCVYRDPARGRMKNVGDFLRNVVQRKEGGLVGRTFKVGAYTIRVEAHLGEGGFASIYRARDTSTMSAFALKHVRMGGEPEAVKDCQTEVC